MEDVSDKVMGELSDEIDAWEQWFDDEIFENAIKDSGSSLKVIDRISYDGYKADGLFKAWIITK